MVSVFSLGDEDFKTIRSDAVRSIAGYQGEWTNYNPADPGIMLLELLAWMQEMQQFYLEHSKTENESCYLELLGISPRRLAPAVVIVSVEADAVTMLHSNTGFYTESICYEPQKPYTLGKERLCKCYAQSAADELLWECISKKELQMGVWLFGEQPEAGHSFYMGFDDCFLPYKRYSIYFDLMQPEEGIRNPVIKGTKELFARYHLEYWNGFQWNHCKVLVDETAGFIQSGFLEWRLEEDEMGIVENLYWLRIRLLDCNYDLPPKLTDLDSHRIKLLQKETLAVSEQILIPLNETGRYQIDLKEYFDSPGEVELFIKDEETYQRIRDWNRQEDCLEFGYTARKERFLTVLVVMNIMNGGIQTRWNATGFPNQVIELEDIYVMGSQLQILVEDEELSDTYRFWSPVSQFQVANSQQECYCFQEEKGKILFGDGIHGKIPERTILITDYVRTLGPEGSIKEKKHFQWRGGTAYNSQAAQGGDATESGTECLNRFWQQEKEHKRAVTLEDYELLVKETPGLLIKRVKAISEEKQGNQITLIVECGGGNRIYDLNPVYKREIRAWLEEKRILGTWVKLEAPDYIPVFIRTELRIYERYHQAEQWIRQELETYIRIQMAGFGANLNYSHLYGMLDSLGCIREIVTLTVHAVGKGIRFRSDGGFTLPERALAVLEEIQIQFVRGI